MVTPLIQFHKFGLGRQTLIKACLGQLLALPDLSKDMYEKSLRHWQNSGL